MMEIVHTRRKDNMRAQIKCNDESTDKIRELSKATRLPANRIGNILVTYALAHVRLIPSNVASYDLQFWDGTSGQSRENTLRLFPQLGNLTSGLERS